MNGDQPVVNTQSFPVWPPPSGGAPWTGRPETGPSYMSTPYGTFPAGKALGVPGTIITPTGPVRTMGGPLN